VVVHRLPDFFGARSLRELTRSLDGLSGPRCLLVQYVPRAFGWKGANVPFCLWLRWQAGRERTWVMFHEVMFLAEGDRRTSHRALATANRWMAALVAGAAHRAFVSIPGWRPMLEPLLRPETTMTWLPVPSGIPVDGDQPAAAAIRERFAGGRQLVGHFGTYGRGIDALLGAALEELAAISDCRVLLLGEGSEAAGPRLTAQHPRLAGRMFATGRLAERELSHHIAACDLMLQPYPDGVSSRRTSAMVALAHGRAMVTTQGRLTEPVWADAGAAILAPVGDAHALAASVAAILFDVREREAVGHRAAALYDARFDVRHSVAALRSLAAA
jgi:glycosyltransferase involved in cell wall biosynthesis